MHIWFYVQIAINIIFAAIFFVTWTKLNRPQKEDPRFSKALQILQTKISILEDLSDRTDKQVRDLCTLLEMKGKDLENTIHQAESQLFEIKKSMQKSLEVAKIFEDKIPHDEIIERQNSKKYIEAARLAHQGMSAEEIAQRIDLAPAEIEFITKVNRDRLMFSEENLPAWVENTTSAPAQNPGKQQALVRDFSNTLNNSYYDELKDLGKKFEQANFQAAAEPAVASVAPAAQAISVSPAPKAHAAVSALAQAASVAATAPSAQHIVRAPKPRVQTFGMNNQIEVKPRTLRSQQNEIQRYEFPKIKVETFQD